MAQWSKKSSRRVARRFLWVPQESLWEKDNNPDFNIDEYENIRNKLSEPSFTVTAKVWITKTNAKGIISKQGNNGGTLAHHDIAIDFLTWLFPDKRYELVKMIGFRIFNLTP